MYIFSQWAHDVYTFEAFSGRIYQWCETCRGLYHKQERVGNYYTFLTHLNSIADQLAEPYTEPAHGENGHSRRMAAYMRQMGTADRVWRQMYTEQEYPAEGMNSIDWDEIYTDSRRAEVPEASGGRGHMQAFERAWRFMRAYVRPPTRLG